MGRILKTVFFLGLIAVLGLLTYSFVGDLSAPTRDVTVPVELETS